MQIMGFNETQAGNLILRTNHHVDKGTPLSELTKRHLDISLKHVLADTSHADDYWRRYLSTQCLPATTRRALREKDITTLGQLVGLVMGNELTASTLDETFDTDHNMCLEGWRWVVTASKAIQKAVPHLIEGVEWIPEVSLDVGEIRVETDKGTYSAFIELDKESLSAIEKKIVMEATQLLPTLVRDAARLVVSQKIRDKLSEVESLKRTQEAIEEEITHLKGEVKS